MRLLTGILLPAVLVILSGPIDGQRDRSSEQNRKELFLYNFMRFVEWPADAFQSPTEAVRVEIIGRDPFDGSLDRLLAGKSVGNRRVVVTHTAAPHAAPFPHVAFVSASEETKIAQVLAAYCHAPVLTLSDIDRFANRGGVIGLIEQEHALRFAINRTAASDARLQVSSKLLYLAVPLFSAVSPCATP